MSGRFDDSIWPAGKWKGTPVNELPKHYLEWVAENMDNAKLVKIAANELANRGEAVPQKKEKNPIDEIGDKLYRKISFLEEKIDDLSQCIRKLMRHEGIDPGSPPQSKESQPTSRIAPSRQESYRRNEEEELSSDVPF